MQPADGKQALRWGHRAGGPCIHICSFRPLATKTHEMVTHYSTGGHYITRGARLSLLPFFVGGRSSGGRPNRGLLVPRTALEVHRLAGGSRWPVQPVRHVSRRDPSGPDLSPCTTHTRVALANTDGTILAVKSIAGVKSNPLTSGECYLLPTIPPPPPKLLIYPILVIGIVLNTPTLGHI